MSIEPRDLFGDTKLGFEQIGEMRHKMGWALSHVIRYRAHLAMLSAPLKDAVKHHQKLAEALAEAVKLKSTLPLEQAFGPKWESTVEDLKPLYTKFDDKIADVTKISEEKLDGIR